MNTATMSAAQPTAPSKAKREGYLFGPIIDFFGLGGASVVAMFVFFLVSDPEAIRADVAFAFILIANIINHPHFAHSYQIFYRDFGRKIGAQTPTNLRYRYWFAGIIAPIGIIAFYCATLAFGDVSWIGYSINVMLFLVGWHYVKQGYGMLSVDSVLKKKFFNDGEKKLLLWNSYATWAFSYIYANNAVIEYDMFGISNYAFKFSQPIYWAGLIFMVGFGAATLAMFGRRLMAGGKGIPLNGVMAYLVSLYVWLIAVRFVPLFALVVPAFHSIQYMMVTTRFQLNVESEKVEQGRKSILSHVIKNAPVAGLVQFYIVGAVLGGIAFWALPFVITAFTDMPQNGYPFGWAFAVFWIFINVHHYLLDNVMWRKGNPDVAKHLFSHH